jgi:uncharacterized protein YggE
MKHFSAFLNGLLASALVFILLFAARPGARAGTTPTPQPVHGAADSTCDASRSIQVSGTAVVNVVPDRVQIQLGVQSNGQTIQKVTQANTEAISRVVGAIKSQGVEAKDIATDWYMIDPLYEDYDSLRIKGYRTNNMLAVTLRDISKVNAVIAAAMSAGANQVTNVEFYTSQLRTYRDKARLLAVQAATEKAQALTKAAGTVTGCVLTISENTSSYYNGWWYGGNQNQWTQNVVQNVAPTAGQGTASGEGPLSLGQISVRAEVGITFGLQ